MLWTLLGNAVYMGCQWAVLIAAVKLTSVESVGYLSLGFAVSAPVFLFLQLRLRAASATDAKFTHQSSDYITLRLICVCFAMCIVWFICVVAHFSQLETRIILCVALAKAVESASDVLYGLSQNLEQMRIIAISMMLRGVLALIAFAALLKLTHRMDIALLGLGGAWALVFLACDLPSAYRVARIREQTVLSLRWQPRILLQLAWLTMPLGISSMLMSLSGNMPRYFVERYLGPKDLGIFSAVGYLTMTGSVVVTSLAEAVTPRLSKYIAARQLIATRQLFFRTIAITCAIGIAGIIFAAVFGRQLLTFAYKPEYAAASYLFLLMMVAASLANIGSLMTYALLSARWFNMHLACLVMLSSLIALACYIAVPRWGAMGAAIACIIGFGGQMLFSGWGVYLCFRRLDNTSTSPVILQPDLAKSA